MTAVDSVCEQPWPSDYGSDRTHVERLTRARDEHHTQDSNRLQSIVAMSDDLDRENESDQDETNQEKRNP